MIYIQRSDKEFKTLETVDQCDTRKEAIQLLTEYRYADPYAYYYLSSRACKEWNI